MYKPLPDPVAGGREVGEGGSPPGAGQPISGGDPGQWGLKPLKTLGNYTFQDFPPEIDPWQGQKAWNPLVKQRFCEMTKWTRNQAEAEHLKTPYQYHTFYNSPGIGHGNVKSLETWVKLRFGANAK